MECSNSPIVGDSSMRSIVWSLHPRVWCIQISETWTHLLCPCGTSTAWSRTFYNHHPFKVSTVRNLEPIFLFIIYLCIYISVKSHSWGSSAVYPLTVFHIGSKTGKNGSDCMQIWQWKSCSWFFCYAEAQSYAAMKEALCWADSSGLFWQIKQSLVECSHLCCWAMRMIASLLLTPGVRHSPKWFWAWCGTSETPGTTHSKQEVYYSQ